MLTLDEIGQSVRNNIQLIIDHVGLLLLVRSVMMITRFCVVAMVSLNGTMR